MKKLFGLLVCSTFMLLACNEANAEKSAPAKAATPAAQPAAQVADASTGSATNPAQSEAQTAQITNIDWAKALEMQKAGAVLIDVRTPAEVAEGTAPGSINIPLQEAEARLAEFPKDKDLLIFCRSGKRSLVASDILVSNGYQRVFNVVGGFMAFPKN